MVEESVRTLRNHRGKTNERRETKEKATWKAHPIVTKMDR